MGQFSDSTYVDAYHIIYKVILDNYPLNSEVTLTTPFVYTVIDPCVPPTSLTLGSSVNGQTYMLTDTAIQVVIPFVIDPSFCPVTSAYTGSDSTIISFDSNTHTVTIFDDDDLSWVAASPLTVDIVGSSDTLSETASFSVIVNDPCPTLA